VIVAALVVMGVVASLRLYPRADAPPYVTTTATRGAVVRSITTTGAVDPVITVMVGAYVSGTLQACYCDYNTEVKAGQLCAKIDPRPYQVVVDQDVAKTYLTLTGHVVSQAISIAGIGLEIADAEQIVADDEQNLDLVRRKLEAGKAAQTDVLIAETQLANDQTLLPPLRQAESAAKHAFSVLLGEFPAWSPPPFPLNA
jgi:multidrug efflux pump subunit AcrA (membrane-fusion protein)